MDLLSRTGFKKESSLEAKNRYGEYWSRAGFKPSAWKQFVTKESLSEIKQLNNFLLAITSKCNSNCKICFTAEDKVDDLSVKDVREIMHLIGSGKRIILFGGEPTVHPQFLKILRTIKESGNEPLVYTNGLKFANKGFAKKTREHVKKVHFSFDGFNPKIYSVMRGGEAQLRTKLLALKNLEELGYQVFLSVTLSKLNKEEIPELLRFVKNNAFVKGLNLIPLVPYGRVEARLSPVTSTEVLDALENASPALEPDYFVEFNKLYANLERLGFKLNAEGPFYHTLFQIDKGFSQLIPVSELKAINNAIKEKRPLRLVYSILKNFKQVFKGFLALKNKWVGEDLVSIRIGEALTPINFKPGTALKTICLAKKDDRLQAFSETTL